MFVTDKDTYNPVRLNAREVLDVKPGTVGTTVLMKDGKSHLVDESEQHIKSLMLVDLTSNIMENV